MSISAAKNDTEGQRQELFLRWKEAVLKGGWFRKNQAWRWPVYKVNLCLSFLPSLLTFLLSVSFSLKLEV